jgi:hypothetical protein
VKKLEKKYIALSSEIIRLTLGSLKHNQSRCRSAETIVSCDNSLYLVEDPLVIATIVSILHFCNDREPAGPTEPQLLNSIMLYR